MAGLGMTYDTPDFRPSPTAEAVASADPIDLADGSPAACVAVAVVPRPVASVAALELHGVSDILAGFDLAARPGMFPPAGLPDPFGDRFLPVDYTAAEAVPDMTAAELDEAWRLLEQREARERRRRQTYRSESCALAAIARPIYTEWDVEAWRAAVKRNRTLPRPRAIFEEAAAIRATWDDREFVVRAGGDPPKKWTAPEVTHRPFADAPQDLA
jgi:hypothetical protein